MNIEKKKKNFLTKLLGTNNRYKRYSGSTLRYGGGKSLAVGNIFEFLPNDLEKVVSPFFGGGSVEFAIAKELGVPVVGYDIFDLLVNFWNYQINEPNALFNKLNSLQPTQDEFENVKKILKEHWNKIDGYDNKLDPLDAAAYYYFNMQLSYGPGFLGWMSSVYKSEKKYYSTINRVKNFNIKNVKVFNENFQTSIPKHINDFLYLDPPYYLDGDSKMFKGIYPMRNFPIHHNGFDHEKLAKLLHNHKGGFILSYNDCTWVRKAYKEFKIFEVKWQYTMGQGETRIGKNRLQREYDNGNIKSSHELIIVGEIKNEN